MPSGHSLGQLGERDDAIRAALASGFDRWEADIRAGLAAMVSSDELRPDAEAAWLASSTLASVQGASLSPRRAETRQPSVAPSTAPSP
jgi:TetR/AcrR family transcriptional repressor of nem operon